MDIDTFETANINATTQSISQSRGECDERHAQLHRFGRVRQRDGVRRRRQYLATDSGNVTGSTNSQDSGDPGEAIAE
jgi:hypothetical protein